MKLLFTAVLSLVLLAVLGGCTGTRQETTAQAVFQSDREINFVVTFKMEGVK